MDYIAEHLTPGGRAGIIVPEGIIFQSGTAYVQLRKLLIENYLIAVVSLPAGVFNPYSGVKTSILVLDKSLAKKTNAIVFFKVENDGFGLGAQRREIIKNDLPQVEAEIIEYLRHLRAGKSVEDFKLILGLVVEKGKIAANGEYNLSRERYREGFVNLSTFPLEPLAGLFKKIGNGVNVTQIDEKGKYRVTRIQTIADGSVDLSKTKFTNDEVKPEFFLHSGDILLSHINSFDHLGKSAIFLRNDDDVIHGINLIRFVPDISRIEPLYAISIFKTDRFIDTVKSFAQKAVNQASVKTSDLREIQIPLPPLEVQKEIVAEIGGYQKIIDGARAVLENYRPHIPIHQNWPMVELGKVARLINGRAYKQEELLSEGPTPVLRVGNFFSNHEWYYSDLQLEEEKYCDAGDLLYAWSASFGPRIWDGPHAIFHYHIWKIETTDAIDKRFLYYLLEADSEKIKSEGHGIGMIHTTKGAMEIRKFPMPPLATQQAIVAELEVEQSLIAANRELVTRFEKKIQTTLARVWGEDEPVEAKG